MVRVRSCADRHEMSDEGDDEPSVTEFFTSETQEGSGGGEGPPDRDERNRDRAPSFTPDLLALLAHQLLGPIATVTASAQTMLRRIGEMSENSILSHAERIERAARRLAALTEQILARTRADAGAIKLDAREIDLKAIVHKVCESNRQRHPARRVEDDLSDLPAIIEGDPVLLEQVFDILLSNALKYSLPHRPVRIAATDTKEDVRIVFHDEGIGVPADELPRLAEPFFRASNAYGTPGTGLGLSLARYILGLHGGSLRFDSCEGRGSVVTAILPKALGMRAGEGI